MLKNAGKLLDCTVPAALRASDSDLLMARIFAALHIVGPLMGQSVTFFLWQTRAGATWQFWTVEALVSSFLLIPLVMRLLNDIGRAALISVQMLVGMSLFGSFFFGGISSPFLPWFLIAMVLGFFYLSKSLMLVLTGVVIQLATFVVVRLMLGEFPTLLDAADLKVANACSMVAALAYMTMLCLYYETVMRFSLSLEQETIEQRHNLNVLQEAMQRAEVASRRKSIFLAKISHELRTPLNAVIGYSEMLRDNFEDRADASRKTADLDRIQAAGRHLLALVNDVIDISVIEANRPELAAEPVVIAHLVDEVVATASPLIRKRDNRLVVMVGQDLGVAQLDPLKVRQSILNLLSNAAKFTAKGTITLSVQRRENPVGPQLCIEVSDDGIGMTQEGVARIFDKFTQAENDTANHYGGTGLGLALTRRFCTMMDGSIEVRSEQGIGSTFTIVVPLLEVDAAPATAMDADCGSIMAVAA